MKKFVIERNIPGVEGLEGAELCGAAARSNEALARLAPRVQWLESFVTKDKTFCVYLAEDIAAVGEHARLSGFPADRVTEVVRVIDPTTGVC
ncbi:DUF4242 domain-containing protein [Sphingomonas sp.]|uniref:DUF4242 domain-containing protein n=1 Tax=Sphingomonas sp. TaxID=28214 RepID=UPI001B1E442A|nr:DUF4242 domain-containing protein [Sphingomonas sp.]MBO9714852.1 DUF4242 domain-containing protein [Sphingomonas sp.]